MKCVGSLPPINEEMNENLGICDTFVRARKDLGSFYHCYGGGKYL